MVMSPEAVTFDLWNTLVHNRNYGEFRIPALKHILLGHGYVFDDEVVEGAYLRGFRYSSEVIRTENYRHVEIEEIVGEVLRLLEVDDSSVFSELVPMYERAVLCDPPVLKEGVFEALDYVRERYRMGLISVTGVSYGRFIRGIMEDHGILDYFEVLSFSDEVKWVKPSVRLFQSIIVALGVAPEEIVHVGDSMKGDVVGAKRSGMRAIWVKTKEQPYVEGYKPDGVITSLLELPEALRSLE
jgi:putative hydrolase of the HAD superfamily